MADAGWGATRSGMWCQDAPSLCPHVWWCAPAGFVRFMTMASLVIGASFVALLKMHPLVKSFIERWPSKYEEEATATWWANHVLSTIHAGSQVWFAAWPIWHLSASTPFVQYWTPTEASSELEMLAAYQVANGAGVFFAYIFVDCFILVYSKSMTIVYLVHHLIFMATCMVVMYDCMAPYLAGWLLMMEMSTIFLNLFSFTRNRLGYAHVLVKILFLTFAATFMIFRCFGVSYIALHFSRSVLNRAPEYLGIARWHLYLLMAVLVSAIGMQAYWGYGILVKLVSVMKADPENVACLGKLRVMKADREGKSGAKKAD